MKFEMNFYINNYREKERISVEEKLLISGFKRKTSLFGTVFRLKYLYKRPGEFLISS